MVEIVDRMSLGRAVSAALTAPTPYEELISLFRAVLVEQPAGGNSEDVALIRRVVERLDATSRDRDRLLALAEDVKHLLEEASSPAEVDRLLELVADRERFLTLMRKHEDGIVSRTSVLSYVAEQRWPRDVRSRLAALTRSEPSRLRAALEDRDIVQLEKLLCH